MKETAKLASVLRMGWSGVIQMLIEMQRDEREKMKWGLVFYY